MLKEVELCVYSLRYPLSYFYPSTFLLCLPPPPMFCGVSNNDVFSSFTESMTHAHDHYWIYGGSRSGLRMLIRGETNAGRASRREAKAKLLGHHMESVPAAHPPRSPRQPPAHLTPDAHELTEVRDVSLSLSFINVVGSIIINHHQPPSFQPLSPLSPPRPAAPSAPKVTVTRCSLRSSHAAWPKLWGQTHNLLLVLTGSTLLEPVASHVGPDRISLPRSLCKQCVDQMMLF